MRRWGTLCCVTLLTMSVATTARASLPPLVCESSSGEVERLTVIDVLSILQSVVSKSACPLDRCDRNCDGAVTVTDALSALHELFCMIPEGCSRCCGE